MDRTKRHFTNLLDSLMKKVYKPPIIEILYIGSTRLLVGSTVEIKQCHCEQHELYGGCNGCKGNCPCGGC